VYSPSEFLRLLSWREVNAAILRGELPLSAWHAKDRLERTVKRGDLVKEES
jgi:hypothetical protein